MKFILLLILCVSACIHPNEDKQHLKSNLLIHDSAGSKSYFEIKKEIIDKRRFFASRYSSITDSVRSELTNYWVNTLSNDLYTQWQNTPWDFNGTTTVPQEGNIACGYFVTTILRDMGLAINRIKLSTCASSEMMKSLTPQQKIKKLSYLSDTAFDDTLKTLGKSVYIIGLDFHTGFIVNDGTDNWFIHSNYIGRKGVCKESILESDALRSSKTRWLISLTHDKTFLERWLRG